MQLDTLSKSKEAAVSLDLLPDRGNSFFDHVYGLQPSFECFSGVPDIEGTWV